MIEKKVEKKNYPVRDNQTLIAKGQDVEPQIDYREMGDCRSPFSTQYHALFPGGFTVKKNLKT